MTFKEFGSIHEIGRSVYCRQARLRDKRDEEWPHYIFSMSFSHMGKRIDQEYLTGTGCFANVREIHPDRATSWKYHLTVGQEHILNTLREHPYAKFKDAEIQAAYLDLLNKHLHIHAFEPKIEDVLQSVSDSVRTVLNGTSRDDFISDFGYVENGKPLLAGAEAYEAVILEGMKWISFLGRDKAIELAECEEE